MSIFNRGKTPSGKPPKSALEPPKYLTAELLSLKALAAGVATSDQQQTALRYIVFDLCGTYDWPYRPGPNHDEMLLQLGKQFVGKRIVHMVDVAQPEEKGS